MTKEPKPLDFIVNGRVVTAQALKAAAPKAVPRKSAGAAESYFKGYRVEGHKPGALEAGKAQRERELARWSRMTEDEKRKARSAREKEPKPWDEAEWRRKTKTTAVRSKPYEVAEAAEQCAVLASREGWLDVRVITISKGEIGDAGGFA